VLELWVQDTVDGMLLSWIWGWVHAVVIVDKAMDFLPNFLVTNISLVFLSQVLETWVEDSVVGMLLSWIWSWVHTVVSIDETMYSLLNLFIPDVSLLGKGSCFIEPLPSWVLETINLIWFSDSSPGLREDRFIVGGEAVDFLNDTVVSDVSLLLLSKVEPLE